MKKIIFLVALTGIVAGCGTQVPQAVLSSYPTMTVTKSDITLPLKYSATLKGTSDVTIKPQVSGQLMEVCITEGQQVKTGDVLFRIDSRNAQLELESAEAQLAAAIAAESSAKLNQEDKLNSYVQTVVNAGNQVNDCLAQCQVAQDKDILYKRQVEVLQDAYIGTHELMNSGKAAYLEVLTAQESLLSAQLSEAENLYDGSMALISLYIALGGATK